MSYLPPQPVKSRKLRERYRERRRKQLVHTALAVLILVVIATLILLISLAIRSCSSSIGQRWAINRNVKRGFENDYASLAGRVKLSCEPTDWVASVSGLVLLQPNDPELSIPGGPGTELRGIDYTSGKTQWEKTLSTPQDSLYAIGQHVITTRTQQTGPLALSLQGYTSAQGDLSWEERLSDLQYVPVAAVGEDYFAVGFTRDDVHRMVIYDPATGTKLRTPRLDTTGLRQSNVNPGLNGLFIAAWDDYFGYYYQNVTGIIDGQDGKLLQQYAATDYLLDGIFDPASQATYIVTQEQTGTSLVHLPSDGPSRRLTTFSYQAHHKLASGGGQLLLAHNTFDAASTPEAIQLTTYELSTGLPTRHWQLPSGWLVAAEFVNGDPGWFVIAISEGVDQTGLPGGEGSIYVVNLAWEDPILVDTLKHPPLGVLAFKQDCIVLERGGRILSLIAEGPYLKKIGKAKYPVMEAHLSNDQQHLVISAQPELDQISGSLFPVEYLCFE